MQGSFLRHSWAIWDALSNTQVLANCCGAQAEWHVAPVFVALSLRHLEITYEIKMSQDVPSTFNLPHKMTFYPLGNLTILQMPCKIKLSRRKRCHPICTSGLLRAAVSVRKKRNPIIFCLSEKKKKKYMEALRLPRKGALANHTLSCPYHAKATWNNFVLHEQCKHIAPATQNAFPHAGSHAWRYQCQSIFIAF